MPPAQADCRNSTPPAPSRGGYFHIFVQMRSVLSVILLLCLFHSSAQDRLYFTNGDCIVGKVTEVTDETVKILSTAERSIIYRYEILLIEYQNGLVEHYTAPSANAIFGSGRIQDNNYQSDNSPVPVLENFGSVNTLALTNADVSVFFEHLNRQKSAGFGVMGAYNFNPYASLQNAFISILSNSKKKYDIGVFANLYPLNLTEKTSFYYGIMMKYTSFRFTRLADTLSTNLINYKHETGSQLATIFTLGTHTSLQGHFFIRTIAGIGGFNMRGSYREEFNAILSAGNTPTHLKFLPKFYFGVNFGFNF